IYYFFSSRRRHTRSKRDWSSDVCSSDLMKWTVGKKLSMIFIILMVVIIIISMVGIISTYTLNKNTKETDDTIIPKLQTIQGLAQKTEKIHGAIQSHILSKDEEFELKYEEEINDLQDEIDEDINKYNDF